jgi:nucleotide-binding universal stress UspA family protein
MHILVATDGLEHARAAVRFASQLAAQAGARVTVLGVAEQVDRDGVARRAIADAGRLLGERGIQYTTKLRHGYPAEQVLQETEQGEYDLIVIGARGRSRLTRFLLGSVSFRILQHAVIPVLIVRQTRPRIRKILVATGGHPESEGTMRYGAQLAGALGAMETLLHVTNPVPRMYTGLEEMDETLRELMQSDTREGRSLRDGARIMEDEEVEGRIELRHGVVEEEIIHEAAQGDYDLIVLGSSLSARAIDWLALGNITRRIIDRTPRPILVVPGRKQQKG